MQFEIGEDSFLKPKKIPDIFLPDIVLFHVLDKRLQVH